MTKTTPAPTPDLAPRDEEIAAACTVSGRLVTRPNSRFAVNAVWVRIWFMITVSASLTTSILMWVE